MKSYTIDSVCATLRSLAAPGLPEKVRTDLRNAIELIRAGEVETALCNLVQSRCDSALAGEDNRPYISATEEIAFWMVYRAKSLIALSNVSECMNLWAKTGKVAEAIKEREKSLRSMAA